MNALRMRSGRLVRWLCQLLWVLALVAGAAHAATEAPVPLGDVIKGARDGLAGAELNDTQRETATAQLNAAAALEKESDRLANDLASLNKQADAPVPEAPPPLTPARRQEQLALWVSRLGQSPGVSVLERLLIQERNASTGLKERIDTAANQLAELISRPGQMLDQMSELRRRADDSAGDPPAEANEPAALLAVRKLHRAAEHRRALTELALHEAQQTTATKRQQQLEVQLQTLRQEETLRAERIHWLNQRIVVESLRHLRNQASQQQLMAETPEAVQDPRIGALAKRNAELAELLYAETTRLSDERNTLAGYERERDQMSAGLRDTQARLRLGGNSAAIGHWLWQQRLALPSLNAVAAKRKSVQRDAAELRLRLYNNTEARYGLTHDAGGGGAQVLGDPDAAGPAQAAASAPSAAEIERLAPWQASQIDLLDQLDPLSRRRITVLEQSDAALHAIVQRGTELRQLMARELLWIPSHHRINAQWLDEWQGQARDLALLPPALAAGARAVARDIADDLLPYLALAAVLLGLIALRLRAPRHLRAIAVEVRDFSQDRFALTLQAIMWTVLMALPVAATALGLGWTLQAAGARQSADLEALGHAIVQMTPPLLLVGLLSALCRPDGMADVHLVWPATRVAVLRRAWPLFALIVLPTILVTLLALNRNVNATISTQARLAVMVLALGLAALLWWILHQRPTASGGQRPRWFRLVGWLGPLACAMAFPLAALGYVFTATVMLGALLTSLVVVLGVSIVNGLLMRWLLLSERGLALKRLHAQHSAASSGVADVEAGETPPDLQNELSLVSVSAQSRRLLRLLRVLLLVAGLAWAWSDVLPALLRLDSVLLWSTSDTDAAGKPITVAVSLMNLLSGLALLLLTFSLARNLPGLLELLLIPSSHVSAATRYTVTTLARYVVSIAGTVAAFGLFGLRWGQLQWMAAALTVGLGFGLQEIFANFVSGLILLVERPFRVGDTITIGELSGTVTRIRTRATTVLDYDNKEIVIPNKTFITGQVTNWTLSDNVTRLIINVGVAYGSPPARVRELLLRAAHENRQVLADPAPTCWFMTLGNSTLDFELRVYVAALGDRLAARSDLNQRITELMGEAGIEIAFPQLDVHVRDLPEPRRAAPDTPPDPAPTPAP